MQNINLRQDGYCVSYCIVCGVCLHCILSPARVHHNPQSLTSRARRVRACRAAATTPSSRTRPAVAFRAKEGHVAAITDFARSPTTNRMVLVAHQAGTGVLQPTRANTNNKEFTGICVRQPSVLPTALLLLRLSHQGTSHAHSVQYYSRRCGTLVFNGTCGFIIDFMWRSSVY